ncbi:MFS transporter [Rhodocyclus tenuis]|uniref:MFS transporter n=1 Tax=Rhodocyclus tenuis TaxID=1066 RepID=UPI001907F438|nr:MFS transporter [Rhodocyclus tenuis]MBK1681748.1 MFS transporter [Rhodocyclus tenuis]
MTNSSTSLSTHSATGAADAPRQPEAGAQPTPDGRSDSEVIALVGFAHGVSHFFHLLLPPLFPWLMAEFALSFSGIGGVITLFFVVSGIGQAAAGVLVDRIGAARVLAGGLACFVIAALLLAFANGLAMLYVVAAIAGLGNCVFHPADFTVLNRHVSTARLGHAFSIHGVSGNVGWALAPLLLTGVASLAGFRVAALAAAVVALAALALVFLRRQVLADPPAAADAPPASKGSSFAYLGALPVWLCFAFFLCITTAFGAMQNFASPILQSMYGLSLAMAASSVSAYLLGGGAGILFGGFLARRGRQETLIALALGAAALLALLLASGLPPAASLLPLLATIGFCTGIAGPSRDLLVRRVATSRFGQAAYGRVYGFVYSGLDAGLALAPLIFASFMDSGRFTAVLLGVAALQTLSIFAAWSAGRSR